MDDLILVLDAGTGGGRAVAVDREGRVRSRSYRAWSYFEPPGLEVVGREFAPDAFRDLLAECARETVAAAGGRIAGVVGTGQRQGCVFIDRDGAPLYGGPNRDARGINYTDEVEARLGADRVWQITGRWPPWIFLPARLEWFRHERPEIFDLIHRILMIPDWVGWLLTGRAATDPSTAADTMLFDINGPGWSNELIAGMGLNPAILPEALTMGVRLGGVTAEAAGRFGLLAGTPVFIGAADTQAAMIAANVFVPGDVCIVAGSTSPVVGVMDAPRIDPCRKLWTGCHPEAGLWLVESNAGDTGAAWRNYVEGHLGLMATDLPALYRRVEELAAAAGIGAGGARAFMGPIVWDLSAMTPCGRAGILTTFPPGPENAGPGHFARALLENIAYALRANLEQVEALAGTARAVFLAGGMTRSELFRSIACDALGRELRVVTEPEATAVGCAAIGFFGLGVYRDLHLARKAMLRYPDILTPDEDAADDYNCLYDQWREEYGRMMEPS